MKNVMGVKDYSLVKIPLGGVVREVYLDSYAILNVDYSLKNFTFGLVSGDYTTDVYGEVRDGKLTVRVMSQNNESVVSFGADNGVYLPAVVPLMAKAKGFPAGKFYLPTFDPFSLVTNELEVNIDTLEEVVTGFGMQKAYRLSLVFSGVSSLMWVDKTGRVIREEETGGMEMVAVSKEKALDMPYIENIDMDLLDDLAVSCEGLIPDPRNSNYLKVLISGIKPEFFDLSDDFQSVVSAEAKSDGGRPAAHRNAGDRYPQGRVRPNDDRDHQSLPAGPFPPDHRLLGVDAPLPGADGDQ